MRRITAAKVAAAAVVAVLIAGGAVKIYSYTLPLSGTSQSPPPCGSQNSAGIPSGCWADDLGYLPTGYVPAPHYPESPVYPCQPGMTATQCQQFQASCGNAICDPNETCGDCPIDCGGPTVGQPCDPYTGRVGSPVGVCQMPLNATGG